MSTLSNSLSYQAKDSFLQHQESQKEFEERIEKAVEKGVEKGVERGINNSSYKGDSNKKKGLLAMLSTKTFKEIVILVITTIVGTGSVLIIHSNLSSGFDKVDLKIDSILKEIKSITEKLDLRINGVETIMDLKINGVETIINSQLEDTKKNIYSQLHGMETNIDSKFKGVKENVDLKFTHVKDLISKFQPAKLGKANHIPSTKIAYNSEGPGPHSFKITTH